MKGNETTKISTRALHLTPVARGLITVTEITPGREVKSSNINERRNQSLGVDRQPTQKNIIDTKNNEGNDRKIHQKERRMDEDVDNKIR